jgi:hypothetical protein
MDALRARIETQSKHECKTLDDDESEPFAFSKDWLFNYTKAKERNRDAID